MQGLELAAITTAEKSTLMPDSTYNHDKGTGVQNIGHDDVFSCNDASTHKCHLRQNGVLTWFCNETVIMIT